MGRGQVGRVGEVDGDVKEGLRGRLDLGKRGLGPDGGVLAYGGGYGGDEAAATGVVVAKV